MVYILKKKDGTKLYLINEKEYTFGRRNCDFTFKNDESLSRKHATISIENSELKLTDNGSKYLTRVNGKVIEKNISTTIQIGDKIRFGVGETEFILDKEPLNTTTSNLSSALKKELGSIIKGLGGEYSEQWTDQCTHLTVEEIVITIKFLNALIADKPVVTPEYWKTYKKNLENKVNPPSCEDFLPPLAEAIINEVSLNYKAERLTLFKDKTFIFTNDKDLRKINDIIKTTGGKAIYWPKNPLSFDTIMKNIDNYIVITPKENEVPANLEPIMDFFESNGRRTIPFNEIAIAVLEASCEKNCNPLFNRAKEVFTKNTNTTKVKIELVPETQSQLVIPTPITVPKIEVIIPDSYEATFEDFAPIAARANSTFNDFAARATSTQNSDVKAEITIEETILEVPETEKLSLKRKPEVPVESLPKRSKIQTKFDAKNPFGNITITRKSRTASSLFEKTQSDLPVPSTSTEQKETPLSKKRPSDNTPSPNEPPSKRPILEKTTTINPFNQFAIKKEPQKASLVPNPFSNMPNLRVTKKTTNSPFTQTAKTKDKVDSGSSKVENRSRRSPSPINFGNITVVSTTNWLQKNVKNESSAIKIDQTIEIDPELQELIDQFNNTVNVVKSHMLIDRKNVTMLDVSKVIGGNYSGVNFKRFKKVPVLKRQTTVLNTTKMVVA